MSLSANAKKLFFIGTLFLGLTIRINRVTLLEIFLMSVALFGGYESLITFQLRYLNAIKILVIPLMTVGAALIVWGVLETVIGKRLSSAFKVIEFRSRPNLSKRFTALRGRVRFWLSLVMVSLLPFFSLNLCEVLGHVMGAYKYDVPLIWMEQRQHALASFLIISIMVAVECYIILDIFGRREKKSN